MEDQTAGRAHGLRVAGRVASTARQALSAVAELYTRDRNAPRRVLTLIGWVWVFHLVTWALGANWWGE